MNNEYLNTLTTVLEQTHPQLVTPYEITFKSVFGAVGGYIDDRIFISSGHFGIALHLPSHVLDELFQSEDATHLKFFPKGHIKKEYAVLPQRILDWSGLHLELQDLLGCSVDLVSERAVDKAFWDRIRKDVITP